MIRKEVESMQELKKEWTTPKVEELVFTSTKGGFVPAMHEATSTGTLS